VTAILGRDVLSQLGTAIANDPGDPLLTAAILHWNAQHVPWSDAWWQFPIYYPTRDALAFSEHLLGLSVLASPIAWLTGNPLVTYNLTTLLTFPLSAMAMYALVHHLTRNHAAAFLAGLAFAFAPYRMSNLPHIQMLASFWAPLALLGLHGFVGPTLAWEGSGGSTQPRTRLLWLVLYGTAWALQAAANGYTLVFFSVLVGLWVLWFVIARKNWRGLAMIVAATGAASLPLAPILYKYASVHAAHGFERSLGEIRAYSADVAAVLCAPTSLTFWGWIRVACRGEGELFPGVALFVLCAAAMFYVISGRPEGRSPRAAIGTADVSLERRGGPLGPPLRWICLALLAVATLYALIVGSVIIAGPWSIDAGVVAISATDIDKPLLVAIFAAVAALLVSLGAHGLAPRGSVLGFYLFAAVMTWALALGPTLTLMGETSGRPGPFALLQGLPGVDGLRVPARFWLMTVICLTTAAGIFLARLLSAGHRTVAGASVVLIAGALLADGWIASIPAQPLPAPVPDAATLRGRIVLQLPISPYSDIAATWRAVTGGWTAINGYSGYAPNYYAALTLAAASADAALFPPLRRNYDLQVVVADDAVALKQAVERQPGVVRGVQRFGSTQYSLPRQRQLPPPSAGERLAIAAVRSPCSSATAARVIDDDERSLWECPDSAEGRELTIDLGRTTAVGSIEYSLGPYAWNVPSQLTIETSVDAASWSEARSGSILGEVIAGGLRDPRSLRAALPFPPRDARYVRIRPLAQPQEFVWFVAGIAVRAP
jgi:hypothetical protein